MGTFLFILGMIMPAGGLGNIFSLFGLVFVAEAASIRNHIWNLIDPVNPANKNRNIASFTENECYQKMRFRKEQVSQLYRLLNFPAFLTTDNNITVTGEYAFCLFLWRLSYPSMLFDLQCGAIVKCRMTGKRLISRD